MVVFYLSAIIPIVIGGVLWARSARISWLEWVIAGAASMAVACAFHAFTLHSLTTDTQTFSGQIAYARHFTAWQEYYEEAIYRTETYVSGTDSRGNPTYSTRVVFDHWESETRWHPEHFALYSNIDTSYQISAAEYRRVVGLFAHEEKDRGQRTTYAHNSRMIGGDIDDRISRPVSGYVYPVNDVRSWRNQLLAGPSVYSFIEVPSTIPVFDWPSSSNPFRSSRLLGSASEAVPIYEWDKLNAQLGPIKKVNLIAIGFGDKSSEISQYQRAKFRGGKKNDLVICYGGDSKHPSWVTVFGWTDSELVKENLQTLILNKGFGQHVLGDIFAEVTRNYQIKDWTAFDHIATSPPPYLIVWCLACLIVTQGIIYWCFLRNQLNGRY